MFDGGGDDSCVGAKLAGGKGFGIYFLEVGFVKAWVGCDLVEVFNLFA